MATRAARWSGQSAHPMRHDRALLMYGSVIFGDHRLGRAELGGPRALYSRRYCWLFARMRGGGGSRAEVKRGLPGYQRAVAARSAPGRVVADRYELVAPLGSGAMGTVWAGVDLLLDRQVAVKEVALPRHGTDREMRKLRKRMLREARMAARLSHPNAVAVYD